MRKRQHAGNHLYSLPTARTSHTHSNPWIYIQMQAQHARTIKQTRIKRALATIAITAPFTCYMINAQQCNILPLGIIAYYQPKARRSIHRVIHSYQWVIHRVIHIPTGYPQIHCILVCTPTPYQVKALHVVWWKRMIYYVCSMMSNEQNHVWCR